MFYRHKMHIKRIERLSISMFIYTFAIAIVSPVYPIFMRNVTGSDAAVGVIFGITSLFGLVFCVLSGEMMQKYGRRMILKMALATVCAGYVFLSFAGSMFDVVIVESMRKIASTAAFLILGVLVRMYSRKNNLDNSESMFYTFGNLAWLVAPAVGGFVALKYGMDAIFYLAALFVALSFATLDWRHVHDRRPQGNVNFHYIRAYIMHKSFMPATYYLTLKSLAREVRRFVQNRNLVLIYMSSFGLYMLFTMQMLYFPLILASFNVNMGMIGLMVALLILPLIIFEIPLTRMSKKIKTKNYIVAGFMVSSAAITLIYFFYGVYTIFALFMVSALGAAMIEPFKDAYILKHTPAHKVDVFFGIYKTSQFLGYFVAPVIASMTIVFLGMQGMFLVIGLILLIFAVVASRLE
ncbi:MAG: hypothetical protein DRN71_01710 [Candidatus Nanohalarchaeota archaeon]|nr:MAG: hypothetical protein DRN71_01710 [Candidatus Nanohaloarchaeota archaeon]